MKAPLGNKLFGIVFLGLFVVSSGVGGYFQYANANSIASLQNQIADLNGNISQKANEIAGLKAQLGDSQKETSRSLQELVTLKSQLANAQNQILSVS